MALGFYDLVPCRRECSLVVVPESILEGDAGGTRRFVGTVATKGVRSEIGQSIENPIQGRARRGDEEDSFGLPDRLSAYLRDDARLAGAWNPLDETQIQARQRDGNGVALIVVQFSVEDLDEGRQGRLEGRGTIGKKGRDQVLNDIAGGLESRHREVVDLH